MKKALAILFIGLFSIIQVGSVGISLYQTKCLKNNLTSYSFKDVGCCCKKETKGISSDKSCCSSKQKSCCSGSTCDKDIVKSKCCDSESLLYKISVSPYENVADIDNSITSIVSLIPIFRTNFSVKFSAKKIKSGFVAYNPPPNIISNTRILIQSFQI